MSKKDDDTRRFGGPGSSHQDRHHPGKNHQPTGKKRSGAETGAVPVPGAPTNSPKSSVSGGGGERDSHHTHTNKRS
jgi:hypothetical protein